MKSRKVYLSGLFAFIAAIAKRKSTLKELPLLCYGRMRLAAQLRIYLAFIYFRVPRVPQLGNWLNVKYIASFAIPVACDTASNAASVKAF